MFDHITFPYPEVKQWLEYGYDKALNGRRTLELKVDCLKTFCHFLITKHQLNKLFHLSKEHIRDFINEMNKLGWAKTYQELHLAHVMAFLRWAVAGGFVDAEEAPILHWKDFKISGKLPKLKAILSPESIFAARTSGYGTLMQVAMFELMLSTGMRIGEIIQLRASDFDWKKIPVDKELQCPSPYVAGTLTLQPGKHIIKNRTYRRIYISKFTAKILFRWMQLRKIPIESNFPLFPISRKAATRSMRSFSRRTGLKIHILQPYLQEDNAYTTDQHVAMEDVDLNNVEDQLLKSMIIRQRSREAQQMRLTGVSKAGSHTKQDRVPRDDLLNPHLMRYTYIGLMFYRTFTGERSNDLAIQLTSGHKVNWILRKYLVENDLVKNDVIWKTLWLGKPDHWINVLKVAATDNELTNGQTHQARYNNYWGKKAQ